MFWNKKNPDNTKVVVDPKKIDDFLLRAVENIYPSKDFLKKRLLEGKKLTMYLGIDPTGPTLHLGHAAILMKLKEFQDLGHQAILLIGDFTGMIGDPSDKSATRKKLTREQVLDNAKLYKKQASTFLDFSGENKALIKYNSDWLSKMNFGDVLELSSLVTVEQMLKRDMFDNRMKEGRPIYIHEFMYPLMQGYDSVAMDVDGEIGGNDQTFNMLMGRDLIKTLKNKEKFVIAGKLFADSTGKKMGKTEGNMVSLDQSHTEMFGKIMSWADGLIIPAFEVLTRVGMDEIEKIKKDIEGGANPRDAKYRLAKEIVAIYHGKEKADEAGAGFDATFSKGGVPDDILTVKVESGIKLVEVLLQNGLVKSKGEFRRLVDEKAISEVSGSGDGTVMGDYDFAIKNDSTWKIGKRRFIKVVL